MGSIVENELLREDRANTGEIGMSLFHQQILDNDDILLITIVSIPKVTVQLEVEIEVRDFNPTCLYSR
jgi:hypothetical protein